MPANDHLQPEQLKMFMSANEIMGSHKPNPADFEDDASDEEGWERKSAEAMESGVYESIEREGVRDPVNLYTKYPDKTTPKREQRIGNGHHRVAVMNDLDPDELMPVLHHGRDARGQTQQMQAIHPGGYPKNRRVASWDRPKPEPKPMGTSTERAFNSMLDKV
jgi:hypothetical protein